jgi:cytochrome d ubiquinol oxidase subunit I
VWSIPLPWIAAEAGWIVAELGRQPWAIEGVLPTAVAVSNLGMQTVLTTLLGFVVLYTILLVVEMKLMLKTIRKGPEPESTGHPGVASPLIGTTPALRTAPMITTE